MLMNNIVGRYLAKQLLFASFVATAVFSGPAILISLSSNLPGGFIFSNLVWPSLASIVPMIMYQILPLLVAGAIVWCYGRFSSEGILVTLHLAGQSISRVRAPAFYVAAAATFIGYALSCVIAPLTAGKLHDVWLYVHRDISPHMLQPGRLNELEGGKLEIVFQKFLGKNEIGSVFIRDKRPGDREKVYVAKRAVFDRNVSKTQLVLLEGSLQEFTPKKGKVQTVNFHRLVSPVAAFGVNLKRHEVFDDERSTLNLLRERATAFADPLTARSWMRDVVKRFGIPALTIIHTLLGLELLALWGVMGERRRQPILIAIAIIASLHLVEIVGTEMIGMSLRWAWATVVLACAELAIAFALMRLQKNLTTGRVKSAVARVLDRVRAVPAAAPPRDYARPLAAR
jgi:lipopolysaccharide export LptBFGC system permease protein LptF